MRWIEKSNYRTQQFQIWCNQSRYIEKASEQREGAGIQLPFDNSIVWGERSFDRRKAYGIIIDVCNETATHMNCEGHLISHQLRWKDDLSGGSRKHIRCMVL